MNNKTLVNLSIKQIAALAKAGEKLMEIEALCRDAGLPDLTLQTSPYTRVQFNERGLEESPGMAKIPPLSEPREPFRMVFRDDYGLTPEQIAGQLGMSADAIKEARDRWHQRFPKVSSYFVKEPDGEPGMASPNKSTDSE